MNQMETIERRIDTWFDNRSTYQWVFIMGYITILSSKPTDNGEVDLNELREYFSAKCTKWYDKEPIVNARFDKIRQALSFNNGFAAGSLFIVDEVHESIRMKKQFIEYIVNKTSIAISDAYIQGLPEDGMPYKTPSPLLGEKLISERYENGIREKVLLKDGRAFYELAFDEEPLTSTTTRLSEEFTNIICEVGHSDVLCNAHGSNYEGNVIDLASKDAEASKMVASVCQMIVFESAAFGSIRVYRYGADLDDGLLTSFIVIEEDLFNEIRRFVEQSVVVEDELDGKGLVATSIYGDGAYFVKKTFGKYPSPLRDLFKLFKAEERR